MGTIEHLSDAGMPRTGQLHGTGQPRGGRESPAIAHLPAGTEAGLVEAVRAGSLDAVGVRHERNRERGLDLGLGPVEDPDLERALNTLENERITGAMRSLPERWRLVLWHAEVEGLEPGEIGPLLGIADRYAEYRQAITAPTDPVRTLSLTRKVLAAVHQAITDPYAQNHCSQAETVGPVPSQDGRRA